MAKDHDQHAREKKLAREYEIKQSARNKAINKQVLLHFPPADSNAYEGKNIYTLCKKLFIPAFSCGKYEKPSDFFLAEMPWLFGLAVYDRHKDAFLYIADQIRAFPYTVQMTRRGYRSQDYLQYAERIASILSRFADFSCVDLDICDILCGTLPEEVCCYLNELHSYQDKFIPEVLAFELDRGNPRLESIVTDIINGESGYSRISYELIRGIVMSRNARMHRLLCKLLVAAKLQEGLRQAICENADYGTMEAFHAILSTILEHDLIRYSSVKRAVGTWIGVMSEETRDLERISSKSVELICKCLMDAAFREECIASEDSMAIHIALWSETFASVQKGQQLLDRIIEQGSRHQILTAGFFVTTLEDPLLRHNAARKVLKIHRDHSDILAVYLPSFLPYARSIIMNLTHSGNDSACSQYFSDQEECIEFSDWLFDRFQSLKQKELVFDPCIFPWYAASVKKSELIEKTMILAVAAKDQGRIDRLCSHIVNCEAGARDLCFNMLTQGEKTPAVRKAILDSLEDKSSDTRCAAFRRAEELTLTETEYRRINGSHAFIDGHLAKYSVHLGSGVVHQIGGTMLHVLPVHSQHRGRFFLPFVDEDPKTAEIISKVILFAEDRKLKDPGILSQIRR